MYVIFVDEKEISMLFLANGVGKSSVTNVFG